MIGKSIVGNAAALAILIVIALFGLIRIVVSSTGVLFGLEILGLLVLLFLSLIGFIGYTRHWGELLLFFVFTLYLANLALIWYVSGALYLILAVVAVVGLVFSFPAQRQRKAPARKVSDTEPYSVVFDDPVQKSKGRGMKEDATTAEIETIGPKSVKTTYSPGKYVASRNSNVYHEPKCEWAKRIHASRRVWFKDKGEARQQQYTKHDCVQ